MARPKSGNRYVDLIGTIFLLIVLLWVVWILFHKQIIAWVTNLLIELAIAIGGVAIVGIGYFIGYKLEEGSHVSAGWGGVVTIAILIGLGYFQLGTIGLILVLLDIGALLAFAWRFIDQSQYNYNR